MGQHINSNIFRLGISKKWKTEFFEKKGYELSLYTFKDLEIKSYIERFLKIHDLMLHDYRQHFNNSTLTLYISYFVSSKFVNSTKDKYDRVVLITNGLDKHKFIKIYVLPITKNLKISLFKVQTPINLYNLKNSLIFRLNQRKKKLQLTYLSKSLQKNSIDSKILNRFFKVLSLFTSNKFNIIINFCCLNKNLSFLKKTQKKSFILFQRFKETPFLKEGIELLFYSIYSNNSANLLANFISMQIKKIKRHKFFLSFLKNVLTILFNSNLSKVRGIKITLKGRLNSLPRAKQKTITIGNIPIQSIDAIIDHSQKTIHNFNGSYGIKVWLVEK